MKHNTKKASLKDQKSSSPSDSKRSEDGLLASMGKREDEIPEVSGSISILNYNVPYYNDITVVRTH